MSVDPPTALSMDDLAAALRFFFGIFDVKYEEIWFSSYLLV